MLRCIISDLYISIMRNFFYHAKQKLFCNRAIHTVFSSSPDSAKKIQNRPLQKHGFLVFVILKTDVFYGHSGTMESTQPT
jgi:hypothetical protein